MNLKKNSTSRTPKKILSLKQTRSTKPAFNSLTHYPKKIRNVGFII